VTAVRCHGYCVAASTDDYKDIDAADAHDPLYSSEYAAFIYDYMKEREVRIISKDGGSCSLHY